VSPDRVETEVDGRRLQVSNLDKVLYPDTGFTKGAMIEYYLRIAPAMLPHVTDRPLTLRRFPNGVDEKSFFEKHAPSHTPSWVRTTHVPTVEKTTPGRRGAGADGVEYAVVCDRPTLIWAANLAAIEFHVPLWHVGDSKVVPGPPDHLVFDLDPGPGTSIVECCRVAGWIAEHLTEAGLGTAIPKTSGSKGLQLYVGLPVGTGWESARPQALGIAQSIEKEHPELVVTKMGKDLRRGRVLIDWSQNHPAKTTVAAYSLRARPEPSVSTPITWDEVTACEESGDPGELRFLAPDVLDRVQRHGDLMAPLALRS
jgi:bifunctional non-homologous end joining protein LigD